MSWHCDGVWCCSVGLRRVFPALFTSGRVPDSRRRGVASTRHSSTNRLCLQPCRLSNELMHNASSVGLAVRCSPHLAVRRLGKQGGLTTQSATGEAMRAGLPPPLVPRLGNIKGNPSQLRPGADTEAVFGKVIGRTTVPGVEALLLLKEPLSAWSAMATVKVNKEAVSGRQELLCVSPFCDNEAESWLARE